jgi:carbon monoxide dehydrogenase subunit G
MELNGERIIPATVEATWAALNDPEILKACIAGCETLERVGDDGFVAVVAMKIAIGDTATRLAYSARATVGGKMAQIGSRLIDATAGKITDDFFKAFEAQLQARVPGGAVIAPIAATREPAGMLGWALAAIIVAATFYLITR